MATPVPAATPVTIPVLPTEATVGALLLHVPPPVISLKVIVWPTHTLAGPVMGAIAFTVITVEVVQPELNT